MKIYTHINIDLDACASVWAYTRFSGVNSAGAGFEFVPANWQGPVPEGDVALDLPIGIKGEKDKDGKVHSCFAFLCKQYGLSEVLIDLIKYIDLQDSTGDPIREIAGEFYDGIDWGPLRTTGLQAILACFKSRHEDLGDRLVYEWMSRIFDDMYIAAKARLEAKRRVEEIPIHKIGNIYVAVLPPGPTSPELGIILNERYGSGHGLCAIYQDGNNLGVTRYPGRVAPNLALLSPYLPDWFIHSAGFLVAWGSRKAPATSPPPEGTPQNQEELFCLLKRILWHWRTI